MTAPARFPDSVYDRIGSYLPTDQREMFFRYVANLRTLDTGDPLLLLAEGMAVFTCISRQVPEALAGEREKLLAEFARLCTKHEATTANATADTRAMFAAQQKLLEQNIATWHNKEQQTARSLDMCAQRFEESADRGISRLEGVCAALHTATKEHQVAAMKAQHWFDRVTLGTKAWPLAACTLGGAMAAVIVQYFLTRS
jgi:hypothetical protein